MTNKKFYLWAGAAIVGIISLRYLYKKSQQKKVDDAKKNELAASKAPTNTGIVPKDYKPVVFIPPATGSYMYPEEVLQGSMTPTINDMSTGKEYLRIPVAQFDISATPAELNRAMF